MGGGRGGQALLLGTWGHWVVFPAPQLRPYRSPSSEDESSDEFPTELGLGGSDETRGRGCRRGSRGLVALSCAFPRGLQRAVAPTRSAGGPGCSSRRAGSRPGQRHGPKSAVKQVKRGVLPPAAFPVLPPSWEQSSSPERSRRRTSG